MITAIQSSTVADSNDELFHGATKLAFKNALGDHQNASQAQVPLDAAEIANNFPRLSQLKDSMEVNTAKGAGKGSRKRKALKQGAEQVSGMLRNMGSQEDFDFGGGGDDKENHRGQPATAAAAETAVAQAEDEEEDDEEEEAVRKNKRKGDRDQSPKAAKASKKDSQSQRALARTQLTSLILSVKTTLQKDVTAISSSDCKAHTANLKALVKKVSSSKPGSIIGDLESTDLDLAESGNKLITVLTNSVKPIIMFHSAKSYKKTTKDIVEHAILVKDSGYALPCSIF